MFVLHYVNARVTSVKYTEIWNSFSEVSGAIFSESWTVMTETKMFMKKSYHKGM